MFLSLFDTSLGQEVTVVHIVIIVLSSLLLGLLISAVYIHTHKKNGYVTSFPVTLIMLPAIISIIIILIGDNIARAFSLAGAFTIIRFRSAPGDPKDIAYVLFTLSVGLSCGLGYIGFGVVFAVILCLVMIVLSKTHFGEPKESDMLLKITIPEELNFPGLFDDILQESTESYHLRRIKTCDFGTLFELSFQIKLKEGVDQKKLIDTLRSRNGNLNISLTLKEYDDRVYSY